MTIKNLPAKVLIDNYVAVLHIENDNYLYLGSADTLNKAGRLCLEVDPFNCKVIEKATLENKG